LLKAEVRAVNEDEKQKNRAKKIDKLISQWRRAVQAAIQISRKDRKLSQAAVAERMAWTPDIMGNVEKGRREITVAEFIVLAKQMGLDPEVMFRRVLEL